MSQWWKRLSLVACLLSLLFAPASPAAGKTAIAIRARHAAPARVQTASSKQSPNAERNRLPPAVRSRAIRYSLIQYTVYFGSVALELAIYAGLWFSGFGVWLRRLASRASGKLFVQCLIFIPIFWLVASAIILPLDFFSDYIVEHQFDLSNQGFASWLGDWAKILALTAAAAIIAAWILYRVIRRSPRGWWFWFWLITVPLLLFVMFGEPYVIEPLFFKFTPLERTQPALTARIERMLSRAGVRIPEDRIYEMNASTKTSALNAYVSGIGRSKHVVVWDTTLRDLTPDETLAVLAHETGHYVLHHVVKEFVFDELIAIAWFFAGFLILAWLMRRWGARTGIEGVGDLAGFPAVMLTLTAIVFLASPLYCGISRHYEHQADQYGLELTYGAVPDPNAAAVRSFEIMGERDLSDPEPNRFIEFWLFTHPPLQERIHFAETYHPWTAGKPMELLKRQ
ncbi:MAG: M48 family metallopeptidase [Terriglobia bacterium]